MFGKTKLLVVLTFALVFVTILLLASVPATSALRSDSKTVAQVIAIGKNDNRAMEHLDYLCNTLGMRPAGSKAHHETAEWAYEEFKKFGLSNVHLEQCGDWPGYPDAGWTTGILDKLTRTVKSADDSLTEQKRVPLFNVVADIPGTEKPDEYVIIGAHYDCVPIGAGALDNGTGVAAAMEAARILTAAGARPERTIRFVLFAGEESGLLGSRGYVKAHPELIPQISTMYNMDNGANFISGISATQPLEDDMRTIFASVAALNPKMPFEVTQVDWLLKGDPNCCDSGKLTQMGEGGPMVVMQALKRMPDGSLQPVQGDPADLAALKQGEVPKGADSTGRRVIIGGCAPGCGGGQQITMEDLKQMGLSEDLLSQIGSDSGGAPMMKSIAIGTSDQSVFLDQGIPGFSWVQHGDSTVTYPAHTADDTSDKVIPAYLEHNATVIALGALGTANLDHMLSREKLTEPATAERAGIPVIGE